jgi:hydrogenase maturation factor
MCIAVVGVVRSREGAVAGVEVEGAVRLVDVGTLRLRVGDFVLVQGRVAIERLGKREAAAAMKAAREAGVGSSA